MDNKYNFKKLLCYNIVNNCKCVYKNKCMFAHTLEEQKKEPNRQFIYNMLYVWEDLSDININEDKQLLDELLILTKECKNCIGKKCPGGYNCKFGTCLKDNKICYNDLMYGKCYNILIENKINSMILYRCIHGIHLSEKKLVPYNQRMLADLTNIETSFILKHNINFSSKSNIISISLNDNTIKYVKDIINGKISKNEIIDNLKIKNQLFNTRTIIEDDDNIFDDILKENEEDIKNTNSNSNSNSDTDLNKFKNVRDYNNLFEINKNLIILEDNCIENYK